MKVAVVDDGQTGADDALVQAARTDADAFAELYRRHYARVYPYARASLASDEDAADAAQHVFMQAWRSLGQFEGRSSFATWLFRIAQNTVIDAQRRRRAVVSWERLPDSEHPTDGLELDDHVMRLDAVDRLHLVLQRLDPEKRALLMLRFAGQLSVSEIAEVVSKRPEAVKKQLTRMLRFLKEHYDVTSA